MVSTDSLGRYAARENAAGLQWLSLKTKSTNPVLKLLIADFLGLAKLENVVIYEV